MSATPVESVPVELNELNEQLNEQLMATKEAAEPSALLRVGIDISIDDMALRPVNDNYVVQFEGKKVHIESLDWRNSWLLRFQILAGWSLFILFGLGEQTLGTLIPRLQVHFNINDLQTALVFLAATTGYFTMAMISEICHVRFGVRGVGVLGTACMTVGYMIAATGPPFGAFIAAYFIVGVGFGCLGASFNGWIGNLVNSSPLLGILHGCYGIGCITTPPLVTALTTRKVNPWGVFHYYFVLGGLSASLMCYMGYTFRHETATKYRLVVLINESRRKIRDSLVKSESNENLEAQLGRDGPVTKEEAADAEHANTSEVSKAADHSLTTENSLADIPQPKPKTSALRSKLVWYIAVIMLIYVCGEAAFGAWLVTFCIRIKHLPYQYSAYMASAFWAGLTTGRMVLGFVTEMYFSDEMMANLTYIAGSLTGQTVFCIAALFNYPAVLFPIVFFLGFFVGPVFPTTIVATVNVLPVHHHASGIGFICAFGGGGGAAAPFLIGLVASSSSQGLRFYPLIVALLYFVLIIGWIVLMVWTKRYKRKGA